MPLAIPDQTIAAQVKVPDAMNTLSSIMNIRNAQQQNQLLQTQNTAAQGDLREKTALRDLANAPGMWNSDGTFNQTKYASVAPGVAATQGPAVAQGNLSNQSTQIANQTNKFSLNAKQQDFAMQQLAPLVDDPSVISAADPSVMQDPEKAAQVRMGLRNVFTTAADNMIKGGLPASAVEARIQPMMDAIQKNPGVFRQNLTNMMKQRLDAGGQVAQSLVPASAQQGLGQDANGNPTVVGRDQFGNVSPIRSAPVQGQPQNTPFVVPPGETPQSVAALQQQRGAINQAASTVPDQHYNNRQIISILDKNGDFSPTGSNAGWIAHLGGMIGSPEMGKDFATDAQKISHFLALQTQANEKAMGVSTDAGRATSEIAAGSIKQTPESLRTAVSINDAGATGVDFFNRGMENAVKQGGVGAVRHFQNAWSQNYDPNAMRLYNAMKNNDTKEKQEVINDLGGINSPRAKELQKKLQNLDALATQGHL